MEIKKFILGVLAVNTYIVPINDKQIYLVDPGQEPQKVIDYIKANNLEIKAIIITHAHLDHIIGIDDVKAEFPEVPLYVPEQEVSWLKDPDLNLGMLSNLRLTIASEPNLVMADLPDIVFIKTPGHSPDSKSFYFPYLKAVFTGDALFKGTIGRTDIPNSDFELLINSIANNLLTLPDDTIVYPGHGFNTDIKDEKNHNPFFIN